MMIVAILKVRQGFAEQFCEYERRVAAIMRKYRGDIERTVVVPTAEDADTFQEIHLIRFPSEDAFTAYQADPERSVLEPRRQAAIVETQIFVGEDGPDYR
jgi:antibiotic biosynthesis monooxygenase (ABM) superfamily enzyme